MNHSEDWKAMDRRTFIKAASAGAAAAAGLSGTAHAEPTATYRTLGRTKLKITTVSMGAMRTSEPAVMQAAFDRGVNYIDTAYVYMDGNNEKIVGKALKGYRDKVYLATKANSRIPQNVKSNVTSSLETSLQRLDVDYVDLFQVHKPSPEVLLSDETKSAVSELKEQGKTKFVGVTTHSDEVKVIDAVLSDPDKVYDTVLVTYHYKSPPELKEAIARAAKAGIGIIAMKTQQGGYETKELGDISPHQAALKFVLQDPNVTAAIPAMENLAQVKEDTAVMPMLDNLTARDLDVLERYNMAIAPYFCLRCDACQASCPYGVDIATINRSLMYAEGYRDMQLARAAFREIPAERGLAMCGNCATCTAECAHSINIAERVETARRVFA